MSVRRTALQTAFAARLAIGPVPTPRALPEPTRQHDGTADAARARMREGVKVLDEMARTERLLALGDALGPAVQPNRAQRRAEARAARRAGKK